MSDRSKRTK